MIELYQNPAGDLVLVKRDPTGDIGFFVDNYQEGDAHRHAECLLAGKSLSYDAYDMSDPLPPSWTRAATWHKGIGHDDYGKVVFSLVYVGDTSFLMATNQAVEYLGLYDLCTKRIIAHVFPDLVDETRRNQLAIKISDWLREEGLQFITLDEATKQWRDKEDLP